MRKIVKIDESLCKGCGECINACAEGVIEMKDGKATVVSESFCDGLGACLKVCPQGALSIEESDSPDHDEKTAKGNQISSGKYPQEETITPCTMPITLDQSRSPKASSGPNASLGDAGPGASNELSGWPIQMRLVRPWAPYLKGASLLVAGDCTAFAYPDISRDFIKGRAALVGCPKLDETGPFVEKLTEILKANEIRDITVLHMTVPCCARLAGLVAEAVKSSGKDVPQRIVKVGIDGILEPPEPV